MTPGTRRHAGILLVILQTVIYGGVSILTLLINDPRYKQNGLRQDLWRAGHAHAGVLLILDPAAKETNKFIYLNYFGAIILAAGLLILGIGLIRKKEKPHLEAV